MKRNEYLIFEIYLDSKEEIEFYKNLLCKEGWLLVPTNEPPKFYFLRKVERE
jgi:hypothetical protein